MKNIKYDIGGKIGDIQDGVLLDIKYNEYNIMDVIADFEDNLGLNVMDNIYVPIRQSVKDGKSRQIIRNKAKNIIRVGVEENIRIFAKQNPQIRRLHKIK